MAGKSQRLVKFGSDVYSSWGRDVQREAVRIIRRAQWFLISLPMATSSVGLRGVGKDRTEGGGDTGRYGLSATVSALQK